MKRAFSLLLALCLILSLLPFGAAAADIVSSGTCGENLNWTLDSDGVLTISGTGEMTDYYYIFYGQSNTPWFSNRESILSAVISDGVTSIGNHAFDSCSSLTSVVIPDGVTNIGERAFNGCSSLTSVTIPNSVTSIEQSAFSDCSSLPSIAIPESVESIGEFAFFGCSGLTSVKIPYSVTIIEQSAFGDCSSLTEILVDENNSSYCSIDGDLYNAGQDILICCPGGKSGAYTFLDSVTSIGNHSFHGCSGLTMVTIPESVTSIGYCAFFDCRNLTSVTIPASVTSIGESAFNHCSSLTDVWYLGTFSQWNSISIGSNNDYLLNATRQYTGAFIDNGECGANITYTLNHDGVLTITGSGAMTSTPWPGEFVRSVVFDGDVTSFCSDAFTDCTALTDVTIPESVTSISGGMFSGCTALTSVTIPGGVTSIGSNAFSGCSSLTSVTIPDGVTSISQSAFSGCSSLTSVTIPDGVTSIEQGAFSGCNHLTSVTIPESITHIGGLAFLGTRLRDVYYGGTLSQWDNITILSDNEMLFIAKLHTLCAGHETEIQNAKEPTCTGDGYTGDTVCVLCGEVLVQGETIPALGHDWSDWIELKPATQESAGLEVSACRNDSEHYRFRTIPKLPSNPFNDVPTGAYYHDSVLWALENGVTTGYADGTFRPDGECTRAQVVTFLWRAAGEPEPASTSNPFSDVSSSAYYCKAVLWALENGITTGVNSTTFNPDGECTRAQVVTFLWRAAGEPEPASTTNPFRDVSSSAYYYKAVLWALENDITTGNTATTFNPTGKCTRAHVVTFLYRAST